MNLLTKNIHDITFDDVVEFCKQKVVEGVQLDYKLKTPKDLAKHFATFSNTQGGLIIIGVGEDAKGLPTSYTGVPNDSKLIDQIHQFASNVTPLPTYDVCTTNEHKGSVFLLIRVDEGAATPYNTLNDPTVWIRVGNVSTPASREELLRLANKKRDAKAARLANVTFAKQYFAARVSEAEYERQQAIQANEDSIYQHPLGSGKHSAMLNITLQPYYPSKHLTTPQDLFNRLHEYCGKEYHHTAFSNGRPDTVPGGVADFVWNKNSGNIRGEQLYTNGVDNLMMDVMDSDLKAGTRKIQVGAIGIHLYSRIKLLQNYYKMTGYSGLVVGSIELIGGTGAAAVPMSSSRLIFFPDNGKIRLDSYSWSFELDTNALNDDVELNKLFAKLMREISWSLGIHDVPDAVIEDYLRNNGWLVPPPSKE